MLSKDKRLRASKDIQLTLLKGKAARESFLTLTWQRNTLERPRVACIVARKVSKRAVVRNKVKRRLRALVRDLVLPNLARRDLDIVITTYPGAEALTFQSLKNLLEHTLLKSGIYKLPAPKQ